ncbi:hypothetical protein K490DRAFT_48416 [Saccharata proteae CBS 121410]|uniref:FZ domain-containing protein n=1 Tax=Saccharata proteae CBS 121410 TaxID=1314787 RepID=A0A9P4HRP7_9PEZI|nr:hypothetical protein K490DRAFT_48416 [Saccharata proteae CBS 121410]
MPIPKLTPLQSRLAASLIASLVLILIYLSIDPSHLAYAAELDSDSILNVDHNHHILLRDVLEDGTWLGDQLDEQEEGEESPGYEPDFLGFTRDIIGRAAEDYTALLNNQPNEMTITANSTTTFAFQNTSLWGNYSESTPELPTVGEKRGTWLWEEREELKKRAEDSNGKPVLEKRQSEGNRTVYISITTCKQPYANGTTTADPPQLTLYVSQSVTSPGPDADGNQTVVPLEGGFANCTLQATGNVYVGVHSPSLPENYTGTWDYQVAASIDAPYHQFNYRDSTDQFVYLVDSDTFSALFVTDNLTQSNPGDPDYDTWMKAGTPFTMFAYSDNSTAVKGLERSFCGLKNAWEVQATALTSGMTTRGLGNKPKEQFYIQGLNGSSSYHGFPAMYGNSTAAGANVVGGGGQVWSYINFTTKSDGNCQVIFNLTFCDEVSYAVPANNYKYNVTSLNSLYDDYARDLYQNFNYSLQQIPCNTTNTAQYSLARGCDDCARDYKNWLCAVTIPRCEDFSNKSPWLQPRNVAFPFINNTNITSAPYTNSTYRFRTAYNSSRNPIIDTDIMPGPYKEVLPCEDLCYSLMQSCPASFGFACPLPGKGLEKSYGSRSGNGEGQLTCSYLGAVYYINGASAALGGWITGRSVAVAAVVALVTGWM